VEGIFALPWQQWLRERTTVLLFTYSAYLVCSQSENWTAAVKWYTSSVRSNKIFCCPYVWSIWRGVGSENYAQSSSKTLL